MFLRAFFCGAVTAIPLAFCAVPTMAESTAETVRPAAADNSAVDARQIAALIAQLGDDDYAVRHRAEDKLLALGAAAFDQLQAAGDDADLEISSGARYLLQQLRVQWNRPGDGKDVQRLLTRYGDLSQPQRQQRIVALGALPHGAGLPALCRIVRFEPSPLAARLAALAAIDLKSLALEALPRDACRKELGPSEREPARWIRLALLSDGPAGDEPQRWRKELDAEQSLLAQRSSDTNALIVQLLLRRQLELCQRLKLVQPTAEALDAYVAVLVEKEGDQDRSEMVAVWQGLDWLIDAHRWDLLDGFAQRHEAAIGANRTLSYYWATALRKAEREADAAQAAEKAFRLPAKEDESCLVIGYQLSKLGQIDWAEREYHAAIKAAPILSRDSLLARIELAGWQADRQDYRAAAQTLQPLSEAAAESRAVQAKLAAELLNHSDASGQQTIQSALALYEFYRGQAFAADKDFAQQRQHLVKAYDLSDDNPDILIAMYRSPQPDEEFRRKTLSHIRAMRVRYQDLIDKSPEEPQMYNQWAWLVANTEGEPGDYDKAVKYSLRSLELSDNHEEPGLLDTLGRCYYAAGDVEKAVESQRRAVEQTPHYQVMQRQLATFEKALAERRKSADAQNSK